MTVALGWVEEGELLTVTCPAAGVTVNDIVVIGGIVGIAKSTQVSGDRLVLYVPKIGSVVRLSKATGFVPTAGQPAVYDTGTDQRLESFSVGAGMRKLGFYAADALTGDTAALVIWNPQAAEQALIRKEVFVPLDATKAVTKTGPFQAPFAGKIVGLSYWADVKPSSAGGTAVLTASNVGVSAHTLLSTATLDMETITEDAVTAMTLTATAADLVMEQGTLATFAVAADNVDLVAGSGLWFFVDFQRT